MRTRIRRIRLDTSFVSWHTHLHDLSRSGPAGDQLNPQRTLKEVSNRNFGLLIAYVVPGAIALAGLSLVVPEVRQWLWGSPAGDSPTIAGFLYSTLASVTLGMTVSVVRWVLIDSLHSKTGLPQPRWEDERLADRLAGYEWLVANHYRYYQFYGNAAVALLFSYIIWKTQTPSPLPGIGWVDASVVVLVGMFIAGSRNALARYYRRATALLGHEKETRLMTNGGHPKTGADKKTDAKAQPGTKSAGDKAADTKATAKK